MLDSVGAKILSVVSCVILVLSVKEVNVVRFEHQYMLCFQTLQTDRWVLVFLGEGII